jgi:hypothetical protein
VPNCVKSDFYAKENDPPPRCQNCGSAILRSIGKRRRPGRQLPSRQLALNAIADTAALAAVAPALLSRTTQRRSTPRRRQASEVKGIGATIRAVAVRCDSGTKQAGSRSRELTSSSPTASRTNGGGDRGSVVDRHFLPRHAHEARHRYRSAIHNLRADLTRQPYERPPPEIAGSVRPISNPRFRRTLRKS